jgi:serine/threonine protein phosphatase PrpC
MEFILDDKGVRASTQADEFRKNTRMNALTILLGTLTGKPAAAGAGMLAQSRQRVFIKWSDVTGVKYKPNSNTILLKSGWTESIAIFCTDKLYDEVSRKVEKHITNNSVSGHAPKR